MNTLKNTILIVLLVLTAVIICNGCSQPIPQKKFTLSNPFYKDRPRRAARMTCIWEPKMLSEKQGLVRGFQGEIIFFRDEKMQQSTMVDGELTVYVYDAEDRTITDLGGGVQGIRPLCEYRFDKEMLARGMEKNKKTKMISYGVWLPIDKMPGDEKNLVLCTKFMGSGDHGELLGTDPGDQINVYLPGNPVPRKKPVQQYAANSGGIRQAAYNEAVDFGNVHLASHADALRLNNPVNPRNDNTTMTMPPGLVRQLYNVPQDQEWPSQNDTMIAANTAGNNTSSAVIGFGGGDTPMPSRAVSNNTSNNAPNTMVAQSVTRNRPNITSIGAQIEQRMQNGIAFASQGQNGGYDSPTNPMVQVAYNQSNTTDRQQMMAIMAEQEQRRRLQEQTINPQGFTGANANSFATDQNRITAPDRWASWGVPQNSYPGQPQGDFAPNRYPAQSPGTSQSAYVQSDWGPGLESLPSGRETQVIYSPPPAGRIYQ